MRGHLQQRDHEAWRVKIYVGRSAEGTKRYVERTVRGTKREAERELARLVVEVDEGRRAARPASGPGRRSRSDTAWRCRRRLVPPTGGSVLRPGVDHGVDGRGDLRLSIVASALEGQDVRNAQAPVTAAREVPRGQLPIVDEPIDVLAGQPEQLARLGR